MGAIRHLVNLSLFPIVFSLPESIASESNYGQKCLAVMEAGWEMWSARASEVSRRAVLHIHARSLLRLGGY